MFIHTLGLTAPKVVDVALTGTIMDTVAGDRRGKHAPSHKLKEGDIEMITTHIKKFHPCVAHYRREHAPNRLYLPSELTVVEMYRDYVAECEKIDVKSFGYSVYQKTVKQMNISFAKLGVEQCEECDEHIQHLQKEGLVSTEAEPDNNVDEEPGDSSEKKKRQSIKKIAKKSKRKGINVDKHQLCGKDGCELCANYQIHRRYFLDLNFQRVLQKLLNAITSNL